MQSRSEGPEQPTPPPGLFTVGHSNRDLDEFIDLLRAHRISSVVDVRKLPGSSRYPHFNADALASSLKAHGISFTRIESLSGRRPVDASVPFEVNAWWQNRSFHNYADHALSREFRAGLSTLLARSTHGRVAIMCAEAVWWRCHRRIIADHAIAAGTPVAHIMSEHSCPEAELSSGAVLHEDGSITYPLATSDGTGGKENQRDSVVEH